jgi:hypothetical protein
MSLEIVNEFGEAFGCGRGTETENEMSVESWKKVVVSE